jgi:hypothetical protein
MINIEDFYEKGYAITSLSHEILPLFWLEIYSTEWVKDPENVYTNIPKWKHEAKKIQEGLLLSGTDDQSAIEKFYAKSYMDSAPDSIKKLSHSITKTPELKQLENIRGKLVLNNLILWNGAERIPYHFDTIDGTDILVLIYLTEEFFWNKEWGGWISVCKDYNDKRLYETEVIPNNGVMLIINNSSPLFKHCVYKLENKNVNRYTFSFSYKHQNIL